jgi:hypothetical protein
MLRLGRAAPIAVVVCAALASVAHGCGVFSSGECTDKALCPDEGDGSNGDDRTTVDVGSGGDGVGGDTNPSDGSGDGTTHGGDGSIDAPFDSFVQPDSPADANDGCPTGENCTNGIDDNCDGLVDCADPLCTSGYACTPAVPNSWFGPVALWEGSNAAPSCAGAYTTDVVDGNYGLIASPANCSCGCGAVTGASCSNVSVTLYSDAQCTATCSSWGLPPNFCVSFGSCGISAAQGSMQPQTPGSCTPNPSKSLPPYSWTGDGRACSYGGPNDTGGCNGGSLCVARATSPYGSKLCIWTSGDVPCPNGGYSVKHTYYTGASDTRDCTLCTCDIPKNGSCSATWMAYSQTQCQGNANGTFSTPLACTAINPATRSIQATNFQLNSGTCNPQGGAAMGSVTPTGPTTVCCEP